MSIQLELVFINVGLLTDLAAAEKAAEYGAVDLTSPFGEPYMVDASPTEESIAADC
jgi:hypothetical protein